uniref:Breast carcinoma-amplified sequence 1 n=1 Tax=Varanus komodoensis TaxID=61221 RepID=A0A8D2Q502_VARKO
VPFLLGEIAVFLFVHVVDARVSVVQDNVAVSSQKTMEISSVSEATGNNLGNEAKTAPPAAKSRFAFAFSRPVPGRTGEQATNSSVESATLDVSSEAPQANKASTERVGLPATAVPEDAQDKNLSQVPLTEIELTAPAKAEDATLPKPKELTLFDRLFRVEKGKDKSKAQEQSQVEEQVEQPVIVVTAEDTAGLQSTPDHVLQRKSTENLDTTTVVKSETSIPPSQEIPTTKQNTKAPEPVTQQPATAAVVITNETPKEITKERSSSTPTPLSKFFWKKVHEDRPFTQAENKEPVGEKTQESSTEKLSMQKGNPQETSRNQREDQQNSREQETAETNSLQNGGDAAKESTPKRAEKRQSLGGFFKGLVLKRMLATRLSHANVLW